jgi:hypothetical protein
MSEHVKAVLLAAIGKRLRVTFSDGVIQSVDIASVDDEGFLHSGPNGIEPAGYWTRFDSVKAIESLAPKP